MWLVDVVFGLFGLVIVAALVLSLVLKRRKEVYHVHGHTIEVFTGWYSHYIMVNGVVVDQIKTMVYWSLNLQANFTGLHINVRIGTGFWRPTITTRINGVIVS
jgi:hypothetical protein